MPSKRDDMMLRVAQLLPIASMAMSSQRRTPLSNLEQSIASAELAVTAETVAAMQIEISRLRAARERLRALVAEREKGEPSVPYWLVLEWIDDLFKRPAPETNARIPPREFDIESHTGLYTEGAQEPAERPWARETAWLVERGDSGPPRYRTMEQGSIVWTDDVNKALRFARRQDAEMFCADDADAWRVAEHMWTGPAVET